MNKKQTIQYIFISIQILYILIINISLHWDHIFI